MEEEEALKGELKRNAEEEEAEEIAGADVKEGEKEVREGTAHSAGEREAKGEAEANERDGVGDI